MGHGKKRQREEFELEPKHDYLFAARHHMDRVRNALTCGLLLKVLPTDELKLAFLREVAAVPNQGDVHNLLRVLLLQDEE